MIQAHIWHKCTLTYGEHFQILSHSEFYLHVRHIGIQNGRHLKSTFSIISGSNAAIDSILVSKCMFCGARNPMVTICIAYFLPKSRHIGFQNGCHLKSSFSIISGSNGAIDSILVSECMFWGQGIKG